MQYKFFVIFSIFLLSCSTRATNILEAEFSFDTSIAENDASISTCDPNDLITLQTDILNCGSCGFFCSTEQADRCTEGSCRCGSEVPCGASEGCRGGSCITADRFEECELQNECSEWQECIKGPFESVGHCLQGCEFNEECRAGYGCISGACTFIECVPEDCDGYDNDCDGEIDESENGGPLSKWCFSGPDIDNISLPCSRGVQICEVSGVWSTCEGEIPPQDESGLLACDGVDNNCDGCVDGDYLEGACTSSSTSLIDILFLVDQSGSMREEMEVVRQAVRLFSIRLSGSAGFKWGIIKIPGDDRTHWTRSELYLNLTNFLDFEVALLEMGIGLGGTEPQWDAVYEAVTGSLMPTPSGVEDFVRWTPSSTRILILFTDEQGQSTRGERGLVPINEESMCASLSSGEVFIPVVSPFYQNDFDDCAYTSIPLPLGDAGSGIACLSNLDCPDISETCEVGQCVTDLVLDTAAALSAIIADPCTT